MTSLIAFIAAYFALLAILTVAARRHRVRVMDIAGELIRAYPNDKKVVDVCSRMISNSYAWRAAPIEVFTLSAMLITPAAETERRAEELFASMPYLRTDPRFVDLDEAYMASVAATNPIFGLLIYLLVYALTLKDTLQRRGAERPSIPSTISMLVPA